MARRVAKSEPARQREAFEYRNLAVSLTYIMGKLAAIDNGKYVDLDFISSEDVDGFCKLLGFRKSWAGATIDDICGKTSKPDYGPQVIRAEEARPILEILMKMVKDSQFKSRDGKPFDKTVLNDYIARPRRFAGEPTLGHFWEFQYALQVELEHGRTRGTNITNNHPLLTALVVMAHIVEDRLYYARLWPMEVEGELTNAILDGGKTKDEIADIAKQWVRAKCYLATRQAQKARAAIDMPA